MNSLRVIVLMLYFQFNLFSQKIEIISQKEINLIEDGYKYSDSISDINKLPNKIKHEINQLLKTYTGEFYDSIKFIKGQIINLDNYEKNNFDDSTLILYYDIKKIVPKYLLIYKLKSLDIDIESINIIIELDKYGQILNFEWPSFLVDKKQFYSIREINTKFSTFIKNNTEIENYQNELFFEFNNLSKEFNWVIISSKSEGGNGIMSGICITNYIDATKK